MARQLLAAGHEIVSDPAQADKVVLNTCAVTREAARDARKRTRRFHRQNETAEVVLTGCYATVAPQALQRVQGAGRIVPNKDKERLVQILDPQAPAELPAFDHEPLLRSFLAASQSNTRAFVKVQDGCDNRCTFCITTVARGAGRSRRLGDVVAEIQALAAAGYREAVLTGVHLGSYGHDFGNSNGLRDLVVAILQHTDIPRLRLSSLEPWDIDEHFFTLWQDSRLLPHLHLPLQSGSDRVLRHMARRTRRQSFRRLVHNAREAIPNLNVSTDIICGFPGESEDDFRGSQDFVREMAFARLHVFTYSPRPGTAAATMPDQVTKAKRKERTRRMIALGQELSLSFHQAYVGRERDVLWESTQGAGDDGLHWAGYTDNYIRVTASGPADLFNRITATRLFDAQAGGLRGAIIGR